MALAVPKLFVEKFELLPLRVAGSRILYLGFDDRLDATSAFAVEKMTELKVESGLVEGAQFQTARSRLLEYRGVEMRLETAADEDVLAARMTAILEQKKPIASRLGAAAPILLDEGLAGERRCWQSGKSAQDRRGCNGLHLYDWLIELLLTHYCWMLRGSVRGRRRVAGRPIVAEGAEAVCLVCFLRRRSSGESSSSWGAAAAAGQARGDCRPAGGCG